MDFVCLYRMDILNMKKNAKILNGEKEEVHEFKYPG